MIDNKYEQAYADKENTAGADEEDMPGADKEDTLGFALSHAARRQELELARAATASSPKTLPRRPPSRTSSTRAARGSEAVGLNLQPFLEDPHPSAILAEVSRHRLNCKVSQKASGE